MPLHLYFNQAMDPMYDHLKNGTALPASQVVRTTPRGGTPGAAPRDHRGERAADRGHAGRRRYDHVQRHDGHRP